MKTEKLFSRIGRTALIAAAILAAPLLTGCSSDADAPNPDAEQTGEPRVHIYFGTPAMAHATRADQYAANNATTMEVTSTEAKITKLYLYVFSVTDKGQASESSKLSFAYDLTDKVTGNDIRNYYKVTGEEGLALPVGDYKFYLLANVDKYVKDFTSPVDENGNISSEITNKPETYITEMTLSNLLNSSSPNFANTNFGGLPMAMMCDDVKVSTSGTEDDANTVANGIVSVGEGSTTLYCDMTFLCSAVRYSFIYDKTSFSWDLKPFSEPTASITNIVSKYKTGVTTTDDKDVSDMTYSSNGQTYDLKDGDTSKTGLEFIANPFKLTIVNSNTAISNSYAYQNTVYLPSNYSTEKKTQLTFTCKIAPLNSTSPQQRTYTITLPNASKESNADNLLARGYFYDIIGKVSSTGVEFMVTVKKWESGTAQAIPL